jgi:Spy/CpxP family protein refolding chaperone
MRKSALLISAAVLAVCLPTLAAAAPPESAPPADPNANSKKFVGDWVGQIFVPAQSMAQPKTAEPA